MIKGLACTLAFVLPLAMAQSPSDSPANPPAPAPATEPAATSPASTTSATSEIEQLKQMLLEQQKQINELRQKLGMTTSPAPAVAPAAAPAVAPANTHTPLGEVASTKPMVPPAPSSAPVFESEAAPAPQAGPDQATSPLQFKLGDAYFTPVGFMDMTSVTRSINTGTGIGTNFGSIPYPNTQGGALTETRFSPQNSRIGLRIDAMVSDMKVLGYWESDFLGQISSPPNGGISVTSNSYPLRLRLYWVDVRKGKSELLGGQSWSLMTPNRRGLSPLPSDVFYSQDMDVNYQLGLVWSRVPGFRYVFHATDQVAFGLALENSEPYVGGGNGGSGVTLPSAISTTNSISGSVLGGQINNGSSQIQAAALMPDIIAKLAIDPTTKFHFEVGGVMIANKIAYPGANTTFPTNTKIGGGGSVNLGFDLAPGFRILTNNYYDNGGGRYIFGQAPDFIIRANGTISLVHSASTVTGFEWTRNKSLLFAYYGGVYISRNMALDANGTTKIGYGPISSDGQNRAIQEITFGENYTIAKSPKWGALNLIMQYSYLQRNPWLVTGTAPSNASLSMGFFDLRYTLPGSAPTMGK